MKKKILTMLLAATMVLGLVACGGSKNNEAKDDKKQTKSEDGQYELALITDVGTIDDKSFNQGAWEGVVAYAEENNISHQYYKPVEGSDEAYKDSIALAVKGGAKAIVLPGYLFEAACYDCQTLYPDVTFILIDGEPHTPDYETYKTESNVLCIMYAEQQAGYLAGWAAVHDGYTKLGFMGGMAVPAVKKFGYGFAAGADAAAADMGLEDGAVTLRYTYLDSFNPTPEINAKASSWYKEGAEVIFSAAGGAGNSVMKAAETAKTKVIGVDVDQATESDTVISSAMKNLKKSVYDALTSFYDGSFEGGKTIVLDASNEGIQLPMETSKWANFTQENYDEVYAKLASGEISIPTDKDAEKPEDLKLTKVTLTVE